MIIEPTQITVGDRTFNDLTHIEPFWACGYVEGTKEILLINSEDEPTGANEHISSMLDGFGSDEWAEFNEEIDNRGLIRPVEE